MDGGSLLERGSLCSGVVRVYTVPDGTLIHDFTGHDDAVFAVALRGDGAQLASASFDQTVRMWNLGRAAPTGFSEGTLILCTRLRTHPTAAALLSAGKDRTIKRINTRTFKEERTYSEHNEEMLRRGCSSRW